MKIKVKVLTAPPHDLATDCLRLSMYFFHPIQQCAQQLYHTAIPLSPTSSQLHRSFLQDIMDDQLSYVATFSGAPNAWGLLLRTIDVRPRQLTCITTFAQRIVGVCEDTVNIYDAVTGILQQSLYAPEIVTKIQYSPDGSTLFFAHLLSITMWDAQTGGLIYTFTTKSKIIDIAVSITGTHIACGSSDGSVAFWNIKTKEGRGFGNNEPVVTICWLSPIRLVVGTQKSVYACDIETLFTSPSLSVPGHMWGLVYLGGNDLMMGTSLPGVQIDQELCSLEIISHQYPKMELGFGRYLNDPKPNHLHSRHGQLKHDRTLQNSQPPHPGQLMYPTHVGNKIACITLPSGVQLFDTVSHNWTTNPPLLDAAISVAVSLNRNLVVQTKDSIQIFSVDVLTSGEARNDTHLSHIYPLGEKHIICILQPTRHLTLLGLEVLQEICPDNNAPLLKSSLINQSSPVHTSLSHGLVAEFGVSAVMQMWQLDTPLPEWTEVAGEAVPLGRLSPKCTWMITVYGPPRQKLCVKDAEGIILADLSLEDDVGTGEVYDLTFNSETRFYLKIDGPGWHIRIPYDIIAVPSGNYPYTITKGEPVPLSEPRVTSPYSLDANCEWVLDAESNKICWISPGNLRRGNGGHFWAGLSLVMLGDDGIVRKLTFKEPDC